ncbi:MAG: hypothetical protein ACXIUQ_03340 [Cecembia sp.]
MEKLKYFNILQFSILITLAVFISCTKEDPAFDPNVRTGELVHGIYIVEATPNTTHFRIDLGEEATFYPSRSLGGINVSKNGVIELQNSFSGILWVEVERKGNTQRTNLPIYVAQFEAMAKDVIRHLVNFQNESLVFISRHAEASIGQDAFGSEEEDWWKSCDPGKARQIDDTGVLQARRIGQGIKALNIPVRQGISSEFCRAYQTLKMMDLTIEISKKAVLNLHLESVENPLDVPEIWPEVKAMIEKQEISNEILVVVSHCNLFDRNPFNEQIGWSSLQGDGFLMVKNSNGSLDFVGPVPNFLWSAFPNMPNL